MQNSSSAPADLESTGPDARRPQPDLLCFSHLRWHFVTQRPQHLLTLAARDRRVFYWEEPIWHAVGELPLQPGGEPGMHLEVLEEAPGLWVIRPPETNSNPSPLV